MGGTLYRETPEFDVVHDELRYRTYADIVGEPDLSKAKQPCSKTNYQFHVWKAYTCTAYGPTTTQIPVLYNREEPPKDCVYHTCSLCFSPTYWCELCNNAKEKRATWDEKCRASRVPYQKGAK